jgi:hypothetical protein
MMKAHKGDPVVQNLQPGEASTTSPSGMLLQRVLDQTPRPGATDGQPAVAGSIALVQVHRVDGGGVWLHGSALGDEPVLATATLVPVGDADLGRWVAINACAGQPSRWVLMGYVMQPHPLNVDVRVDGQSVSVKAQNEIELRCGQAAIVLTADGRITLRGTYITSHASATQRILGGSVNLN